MLDCLFFHKAIDSLMYVPNFLFSDAYLNLLFNFKDGPSSDLSCLVSSMFIITVIIRIIKTTWFNNNYFDSGTRGKAFLK